MSATALPRHEPIVWNKSENGSEAGDEEAEEEGRISGEHLDREAAPEQQPPAELPKREEGEQQIEEESSGRNHEGETGKSAALENREGDYKDWDRSPENSPRREGSRHNRLPPSEPPLRQPHDRRVNGGGGRFYSPRGFSRGRGGAPYYPRRFRSRSPMRNRSRSRSPGFRRQFPPSSYGAYRGPRARSPPPPPPPPPYGRGGFRGRGRSMYSREYMFSRSRGSEYDRGMPHDRYSAMDPSDRFGSRGYRERGMDFPPYRGGSRGYDAWNGDDRHRRPVEYQRGYSPPREYRKGRLEEFYDGRRRQAELERQSRPSSRPELDAEDHRDSKKPDNVKEDSWGEDNRGENWNYDKLSKEWYYMDPQGATQGPCSIEQFKQWLENMRKDDKLLSEYEKFKSVTVWKEGLEKRIPLMLLLKNTRA